MTYFGVYEWPDRLLSIAHEYGGLNAERLGLAAWRLALPPGSM
jgi:hypothetical protein